MEQPVSSMNMERETVQTKEVTAKQVQELEDRYWEDFRKIMTPSISYKNQSAMLHEIADNYDKALRSLFE